MPVNEFEVGKIHELGDLRQERVKEALQDGGALEQHFKERIVVHGLTPMRLMFRLLRFYFRNSMTFLAADIRGLTLTDAGRKQNACCRRPSVSVSGLTVFVFSQPAGKVRERGKIEQRFSESFDFLEWESADSFLL
jgi:hypothetical protein